MKLWNKILISTMIILIVLPVPALAHTHLTNSDPSDGAIIDTPLTEITLSFDTSIESLSTFELIDEHNESIPVDIEIDHDVMTGYLSQQLIDGLYVVQWDIIGVDGHPMKGEFSFEIIDQPLTSDDNTEDESSGENNETTDSNEHSTVPENEDNDEIAADPSSETHDEQAELEQLEGSDTQNEKSPLLISVIGALLIIVIASIWWFARRKIF